MFENGTEASLENVRARVEGGIRDHPLAATSIAALGGFCVGLLLTRSLTQVDEPSRTAQLSEATLDALRKLVPNNLLRG